MISKQGLKTVLSSSRDQWTKCISLENSNHGNIRAKFECQGHDEDLALLYEIKQAGNRRVYNELVLEISLKTNTLSR